VRKIILITLFSFTTLNVLHSIQPIHNFYAGTQVGNIFSAYNYYISADATHVLPSKHKEYKNTFFYNVNAGYDYRIGDTSYMVGAQLYKLQGQTKYSCAWHPQDNIMSINIKTKQNYIAALAFTVPAYQSFLSLKVGQLFYKSKINSYDSAQVGMPTQQPYQSQKQKTSVPIAGLGFKTPIKNSVNFTADYFFSKQKNLKVNHGMFINSSYKIYNHFALVGFNYQF